MILFLIEDLKGKKKLNGDFCGNCLFLFITDNFEKFLICVRIRKCFYLDNHELFLEKSGSISFWFPPQGTLKFNVDRMAKGKHEPAEIRGALRNSSGGAPVMLSKYFNVLGNINTIKTDPLCFFNGNLHKDRSTAI